MKRHELERILSKRGACSRTQAREWIRAGRVTLGGRVLRDPAQWLDLEEPGLELDGRPLEPAPALYLAFHKPRGLITTRTDPRGRPTIYSQLGELSEWVSAVGRLDRETSGLLLLTNDTHFAEWVCDPASQVEKVYRVEARPRLDEAALEKLRRGVVLSDGPARALRVEKLGDRGPCTRFLIVLDEGRNREVRRMVQAVGSRVEKLVRLEIGGIELGELASGRHRPLEQSELKQLGYPGLRAKLNRRREAR